MRLKMQKNRNVKTNSIRVKYLILFSLFIFCCSISAQTKSQIEAATRLKKERDLDCTKPDQQRIAAEIKAKDNFNARAFITHYYSDFKTGYNFDGKYKPVTDHYKTAFSGSIFTLNFDSFSDDRKEERKIQFDFEKVLAITPYGGEMVEIKDPENISIPISNRLLFKTVGNEYMINVKVDLEGDLTKTKIYQTFLTLVNNGKGLN